MTKSQYTLFIRFVTGETSEILLHTPHKLVPDQVKPLALVYNDGEGYLHNIPFSSILDFWFNVEDYNDCESGATNQQPTPGCNCAQCKKLKEKLADEKGT